jgi:hypothetical protein
MAVDAPASAAAGVRHAGRGRMPSRFARQNNRKLTNIYINLQWFCCSGYQEGWLSGQIHDALPKNDEYPVIFTVLREIRQLAACSVGTAG